MSSTKLTLPASAQRVLAIATAGALLPLGLAGAASAQTVPPLVDIRDNACPEDQVTDQGYNDIDGVNDEQKLAINCIADYGIAQGTTTTTYGPTQGVSRAQMALFLARYLDYAGVDLDTSDAGFTDLAGLSQDARNAINIVANAEIALGKTASTYRPTDGVSRAQMASFINRLQAAVEGTDTSSFDTNTDYFTDDEGLLAEDDINAIASAGIAGGTGGGRYSPTAGVSRAQMALFIARSLQFNIDAGNFDSVYSTNPAFDNIVVTRVGEGALVAVPNPDSDTSDNADYNVTGLEAGVEYRVTILEAGTVTGDDDSATFTDSDNDNLAEIGTFSADLTAVNGVSPVNNDGSGRPATTFNGNTAVFTAGANGTASFTIDGNAADVVRPVVYRNGGGDTDMTPEQGGSSGRLELNDDNTAVEAFGLGGIVTFTAPVLESVTVSPQDTVTLTLATGEVSDNDPADANRSTSDNRSYTVTGLTDGTRYRISLVNADSIQGNAGSRTFLSSEITPATTPRTFAVDVGEDIADIISVNGATQAADTDSTTATSVNGSITFTVDGTSTGTVVPAVYVDGTAGVDGDATTGGDNPRLETSATAAGQFAAAIEVFGFGGPATFTLPAAASQQLAPTDVTDVNKDANQFSANNAAGNGVNFTYDANDTFNIAGVPVTLDEFEVRLSSGDAIQASYSNNPALSSSFTLTNNNPAVPAAPTATVANSNDVTVSGTVAGDVDSVQVQRATVPASGTPTFATIATVTPTSAGAYTYVDNDVPAGNYQYQVIAVNNGDASAPSTATATVTTTAPGPDQTEPLAIDTVLTTNAGLSGDLGAGDVFKVVFNENLAAPSSTTTFRLNDADTTVADLVNGQNATFTVNASVETVNGVSRAAGRVLTVSVTGAPAIVVAGTVAGVQLAAVITAVGGITDVAGNVFLPTTATQDVTVEALGADTQNDSTVLAATITAAAPVAGATSVVFTSDQPLTASSVALGDFTGTATRSAVSVSADGTVITVTVTALTAGQTVTLTANSVVDRSGNLSPAADVTATATA